MSDDQVSTVRGCALLMLLCLLGAILAGVILGLAVVGMLFLIWWL